jgi:hypothetical protein
MHQRYLAGEGLPGVDLDASMRGFHMRDTIKVIDSKLSQAIGLSENPCDLKDAVVRLSGLSAHGQ